MWTDLVGMTKVFFTRIPNHNLFSLNITKSYPSCIWFSLLSVKELVQKMMSCKQQHHLCKRAKSIPFALDSWRYISMFMLPVYYQKHQAKANQYSDLSFQSKSSVETCSLIRIVDHSTSGCQKKQMEVLRTSAQTYNDIIRASTMSPPEAYLSYALYLRPKLSYPLPCTSLTRSQCQNIQAPALAALLPKLQLNRHSPRAVLFSGPKFGSLSLPDLYNDQGMGQLLLLVDHLKLGDNNGKLILSLLSHIQLTVGYNMSIFSLDFSIYEKVIEHNWIISIWSYANSAKIYVDIEDQWLPELNREGDVMLMDRALHLNLSTAQLRQINACQLYLQVFTISDISNAAGTHILNNVIKGRRTDDRKSKLNWPVTRRPTTWAAWKHLLQHISSGSKLERSLGP
jgi:hypothetical protein